VAVLAVVSGGPRGFGAAVHGQQSSSVHTVRIDAIALDGRGAAVRALNAAEFEVRQGGEPVTIDEARFIQDGPRAIGIYLDEYHITAGASADRARAALTELIDREIGPQDVVVIMRSLDSLLTIQPAADRDGVRRIVASIEGRKGDLEPRSAYERSHMSNSPERIEAARTQVAVSALNALAVRLATLNELRKTMLVVTEGLDTLPRRRGQEYLATIESVVRSASRGNVSIYPIDPRPESATASDGADDALASLADQTAGRLVRGDAEDLASAIQDAVREANAYYLLTYRSAPEENGAFHPVEVRAKRAGVQVRARRGFWAPSANDRLGAELLALANRPPAPVRVEPVRRNSPLIRPWFGLSLTDDRKLRVTFVWEPSAAVPGASMPVTAARLELTVLGDDDAVVFQGPVLPTGQFAAPGAEPSRAVFETEPGRLRLRMKIQDAERREVDSDVRDLDVRDVRGRLTIGTPEFLRARNALEIRALRNNPSPVPVSSREFSRAERLLIRFPAYAPNGTGVSASARLLNFAGQTMRTLEAATLTDSVYEIELSLAGLASGEYQIEIVAAGAGEQVSERFGFRVTS
jgi:VWFA-related protein